MADPTSAFFEELATRGMEPLVARARGTVRFDLFDSRGTESWLVTIDKGNIAVSRDDGGGAADTVFRSSRTFFDQIATGKVNVVAARLRGAVTVEGDMQLAVLFQRLFPGPPRRRVVKRSRR